MKGVEYRPNAVLVVFRNDGDFFAFFITSRRDLECVEGGCYGCPDGVLSDILAGADTLFPCCEQNRRVEKDTLSPSSKSESDISWIRLWLASFAIEKAVWVEFLRLRVDSRIVQHGPMRRLVHI